MSEIKTLEMPKWGLSMEEGLLARWAIQEGDDFTRGQEICEIETSKIVNVLEAPFLRVRYVGYSPARVRRFR